MRKEKAGGGASAALLPPEESPPSLSPSLPPEDRVTRWAAKAWAASSAVFFLAAASLMGTWDKIEIRGRKSMHET